MPIQFENKYWEFQDLVNHLKGRKGIACPPCFVQKLEQEQASLSHGVATATALMQGSTMVADFGNDQLFEKNGKKFAKIFLISSATNLKKWQVTPESIPRRLQTFVGRPYISEPKLEHFNADFMPVDQILQKQEEYKAGNIRDVVIGADNIAYAVVEFADNEIGNRAWREMKNGKAIYSSPAVAGLSRDVNGIRLFTDWFGLHLARVSQPAYGVFHATIKETCEGNEQTCIRNLVASASAYMEDSSEILKLFSNKQMQTNNTVPGTAQTQDCPPGPEGEDCRSKQIQNLTASIEQLKTELASLKAGKGTAVNIPGSEGQTTPVTDGVPPKEKQIKTGQDEHGCGEGMHWVEGQGCVPIGQSASAQECPEGHEMVDGECVKKAETAAIKDLQAKVASFENEKKQNLINEFVTDHQTAGIPLSEEQITVLSKLSPSEIETRMLNETPLLQALANANEASGRVPSNSTKIVRMPQGAATASMGGSQLPTNLNQVRKWY